MRGFVQALALRHYRPVVVAVLFTAATAIRHLAGVRGPIWTDSPHWVAVATNLFCLGLVLWLAYVLLRAAQTHCFGPVFHSAFASGVLCISTALVFGALNGLLRPDVFQGAFLGRLLSEPYPLWMSVGLLLVTTAIAGAAERVRKMQYERDSLQVVLSLSETVSLMNVDQILTETVNCVRRLTDADAVLLYLLDEKADLLRVEANYHSPGIYDLAYVNRMVNFPCPKGHGLTGTVMETGEPLLCRDTSRDARKQRPAGTVPGPETVLLLPMKVRDRLIGVLRVTKIGIDRIPDHQVTICAILANHAAVALHTGGMYHEVLRASRTDHLTGLPNARAFREEMQQAVQTNRPFGLLMLDADSLKRVNDTLGHQAGDQLLVDLAGAMLVAGEGFGGLPFRYAGDEFMLILYGASRQESMLVAERIRSELANILIFGPNGPIAATVSIGVAGFPSHGNTVEELLRAVDRAMYMAKHEGKNRVCQAS